MLEIWVCFPTPLWNLIFRPVMEYTCTYRVIPCYTGVLSVCASYVSVFYGSLREIKATLNTT